MKATVIIIATMIVLSGCQKKVSGDSDYKSPNAQVKCDAFYALFTGSGTNFKETLNLKQLIGSSTSQIHDLLGQPTRIGTLEHGGVRWLEVTYQFDTWPSAAPKQARESWEKGWRYAPSLVFRNGVVVSDQTMWSELELGKYPMTPKHLRFKQGGVFP